MLIELKDGDTIVVNVPRGADNKDLIEHLKRMAPDGNNVKVLIVESDHTFGMDVYRPPVAPAPIEEHDDWHPWETAPRDGQEIDVWIPGGRGRVPEVYFEHGVFFYHDEGEKCDLVTRFGTPSHWRYPPKGPQA
jgi:hypothetical protein